MENICVDCGLCCEGAFFSCVDLTGNDDLDKLRKLGAEVSQRDNVAVLEHPCVCSTSRGCSIYAERPEICRSYNCKLQVAHSRGKVTTADAKQIIAKMASFVRDTQFRQDLEELTQTSGLSVVNLLTHAEVKISELAEAASLRVRYQELLLRAFAANRFAERHFLRKSEEADFKSATPTNKAV